MLRELGFGVWILAGVLDIILVAVIAYFVSRMLNERYREDQQNRANNVFLSPNEQAKTIELEARNRAGKIIQEAEQDLSRRRKELVTE